MKLQALALPLVAFQVLANPVRKDVNQQIYTLRLTSPEPYFNGTYLTTTALPATTTDPNQSPTQNNTQLGVYADAHSPRVYFYAVSDPATGLSSLRDASTGHTLALLGANGLLKFAGLADPEGVSLPAGATCDWTSFRLVEDGQEVQYAGTDGGKGVTDGSGAGGGGRWVAFPNAEAAAGEKMKRAGGGWNVVWKGAEAWTTDDYMPVQVVYELVTNA